MRQQITLVELAQVLADALQLRQDRAALRFGGMRREHQFDAQLIEQRRHLLARHAVLLQLPDRVGDRFTDRVGVDDRAGAGAAPAPGSSLRRH